MNFAQMLQATPLSAGSPSKRGQRTPEQIEKHRQAMLAKNRKRWMDAFAHFGNQATSLQLAAYFGRSAMSVNSTLIKWRKQPDSPVKVLGKVAKTGPGFPQVLYTWIEPAR